MYSLEDIWNQATSDDYAVNLDGDGYESRLVYGVKIIRDNETESIQILNTMRGGSYYTPINSQEAQVFHKKGWRNGVYVVALSNYRKLELKLMAGIVTRQFSLTNHTDKEFLVGIMKSKKN